ncbi:MAG: tyrosine-protein phosphatase [Chloroflexi bacterium]|nr:tyrosine-protein phosphatase [Chloroflexota bacterium]
MTECILGLVANTRDLGGLAGAHGRKLKRRRLIRSSSFAFLNDVRADAMTTALGIGHYFDLRTEREITRDGGLNLLVARGWTWHRLPIQDQLDLDDSEDKPLNVATPHPSLMRNYEEVVQQIIACLMPSDVAVIACSLGKDRTGIVVALILKWLGVSLSDTVEDFLCSNVQLHRDADLLPPRWRSESREMTEVVPEICIAAFLAFDIRSLPDEQREDWFE